jgi:hypothetical protein
VIVVKLAEQPGKDQVRDFPLPGTEGHPLVTIIRLAGRSTGPGYDDDPALRAAACARRSPSSSLAGTSIGSPDDVRPTS